MSIRRRQVLAWLLGSGIPILAIAVIPIVRRGPQLFPLAVPIVFMSVVALVAGCVVSINLAHSFGGPIDAVRAALDRVRAGELSVAVPVNDAGEVGLLQAGVNEMVVGLRERQRLHDLFGRHVGEDVARRALSRGVGLSAEQREVTVFFVDMVGSTALSDTRPAAEVIEMLNAFFVVVVRAVGSEGGWVNKFEGDAALCVFGAPAAQPDHAARALRAALRLRADLVALGQRDISAGIGVSSGMVVAGNIGAEERYEYTVIGPPVNEASRITDEAKRHPSRLLASKSVMDCVQPAAQTWRSVGTTVLRGFAAPTELYEPVASHEG
jgi:adenylate cyclase